MDKNSYLKSLISDISEEKEISFNLVNSYINNTVLNIFKLKFKTLFLFLNFSDVWVFYFFKCRDAISLRKSFLLTYSSLSKLNYFYLNKRLVFSSFKRRDLYSAKLSLSELFNSFEKYKFMNEFFSFHGKVVNGLVIRIFDNYCLVYIKSYIYGIFSELEFIKNERLFINLQLKFYVKKIVYQNGFPFLYLSRQSNDLLLSLFKLEVPEVNSNLVFIKDFVREPGVCAKVVVYSFYPDIDPIGTFLGLNALRIKNISKHLNFEKIDLIKWDKDLRKYFLNMLYFLNVVNIELNYKKKMVFVFLNEFEIDNILHENNLNFYLLSKLITWKIKILNLIN